MNGSSETVCLPAVWTKYEYRSYKEDFWVMNSKNSKTFERGLKIRTNEKRFNVPELIKNSFIEGWNYSPSTHWNDTQTVIQLHIKWGFLQSSVELSLQLISLTNEMSIQ